MIGNLTQFAASCANKGVELIPPWYKYLDGNTDADGSHCTVQFNFPADIGSVGLALTEVLLRIGALVAVGYIIYGGIMYMTSQGEPDKAKGAQQAITNAVIGLVITIMATGVIAFIGSKLV